MRTLLLALASLITLASHAQKIKSKSTDVSVPSSIPDSVFKSLQWRNVGPFRGGRSNTITGVKGNDKIYYAGYTGGGVWKTTDGGHHWINVSDGFLKTSTIGAISVSESDPNVVYVGTGEHAVRGVMTTFGDGVYKSTDAGKTWKHIGLTKTRHISDIMVHPTNPDIVYVGAQGTVHGPNQERGVYKSIDGGLTWTQSLHINDSTGIASLQMDMTNPRVLYAAAWEHRRYPWVVISGGKGSGIYKSTDAGETWELLKEGLPEKMGKIGVAVSRSNPNRVYAIIETERANAGLYRSDDAGKTWTLYGKGADLVGRAWYYIKVAADPINEDVVYVLNFMVQKSIDGGKTFKAIDIQHGDTHALWINSSKSNNFALADDGGAQITFDGAQSWSTIYNQPTAQFYRVNTDNMFPYKIYGGQQDNTSVIISSRNNKGEITERDWSYGPGGESAYLVMNPNDPNIVYGGGYQGFIDRMDMKSGEVKSIQAYPSNMMANTPKDMKYRFNWNFPVLVSKHDPNVVYHAGNVLFKSKNEGISWDVISPDLTRNDKSKQIDGGMPFTNEGAGGEVYNTIYYVAESSIEKGELWTASDDGLIYVTKDEGAHWDNVTPKELAECLVQSIELSSFDKGTAYITGTRYKFNDFASYTYKTTNYGKSWTKITNGLKADDFLKVIREDKKNKNILYAGAEHGFYISFNAGASWESMQLNLPLVPITDLMIHENDLIAATAGRAFWVLDDMGALQQIGNKEMNNISAIIQPKVSYRYGAGTGLPDKNPTAGQDAPTGVIVDFYVPEITEKEEVALTIMNAQNKIVRIFSNQKDSSVEEGASTTSIFKVITGHNRFLWDMRGVALVPKINGLEGGGVRSGAMVMPGEYTMILKVKGQSFETKATLLPNPLLLGVKESDWTTQQEMLLRIANDLKSLQTTINAMRTAKEQLAAQTKTYVNVKEADTVVKLAKSIIKDLDTWEARVLETRSGGGQDVINYPGKLNVEFTSLYGYLDVADPRVTSGAKERLNDLEVILKKEMDRLDVIKKDIATYNKLFKDRQFDIIHF